MKQALTGKAPAPEPQPSRRKRSEETRGGFRLAASIMRRVRSIFHPWEPPDEFDDAQRQQLYWNDQASIHQSHETDGFHSDASNHLFPHNLEFGLVFAVPDERDLFAVRRERRLQLRP